MHSASTIKGSAPVYSHFRFGALGTQWEIATREPLDDALRQLIMKRIDEFERTYSRFRDDSLVAHIAASHEGGRFLFPEDSTALFDLYDRLHEATGGAVDPLVGRRPELLGYDRTYSLTPAPAGVREAEALARPKWSSAVVVGKPIAEVQVGRLAGSSGTPDGSTERSTRSSSRRGGLADARIGDVRRRRHPCRGRPRRLPRDERLRSPDVPDQAVGGDR